MNSMRLPSTLKISLSEDHVCVLNLAIVQNHETQFDAPLYQRIEREGQIDLTVIYSEPRPDGLAAVDPEIGVTPQWDHLGAHRYRAIWISRPGVLAAVEMARKIWCLRPDLVVIAGYFPRSHLFLALLLKVSGQPIGLRSDNTLQHTRFGGFRGRLRHWGIGVLQRLFDTWHPVGEQAQAYLLRLSGTSRPSFPFPYAVDRDWFASGAAASRRERKRFLDEQSWPAEAFVVLGIVKWTPREDPLTLIEAFRLLLTDHPSARLILVGDGPLRDQVRAALASLGPAVLCPGYVAYSSLPGWYGRADVFVHPAVDEPWGVSVNEALASSLPVVASSGVGAAAELIRPGGCGLEFPSGDAVALAQALERLLLDPALRQRYSRAAAQTAEAHDAGCSIDQFQAALACVQHA